MQLALVITGQSAISADPCGALDDLQDPTARARNCHRGAGSLIAGPFILKIFADAGYQGARAAVAVASTGSWVLEIVKRTELHKFAVLPKALDRRKDAGMDQPKSPTGPRLRALRAHRRCLHPSRHDQAHAATID